MTTKILQKHLLKGTREFELVGDTIEYRITTARSVEELTVVLSVLSPNPVRDGSMLYFISEVNKEPLVKMFVDNPDPETFQAFVGAVQQRIRDEDFGQLAASNRGSDVSAEQVATTISMLETYLNPDDFPELMTALRDLHSNPSDRMKLNHVADVFNNLGPEKGPVLTYAPFFVSLLSNNDLDDPD